MKNIIKLLHVVTCISLVMACSSTTSYTSSEYTIEKYDSCINPTEEQFLERYKTKIYRHTDCMGIENLVAIAWVGDSDGDSITGAKLLALGYASQYNNIHRPPETHCVSYLNVGSFPYRKRLTGHVAFFRLTACSSVNSSI